MENLHVFHNGKKESLLNTRSLAGLAAGFSSTPPADTKTNVRTFAKVQKHVRKRARVGASAEQEMRRDGDGDGDRERDREREKKKENKRQNTAMEKEWREGGERGEVKGEREGTLAKLLPVGPLKARSFCPKFTTGFPWQSVMISAAGLSAMNKFTANNTLVASTTKSPVKKEARSTVSPEQIDCQ